MQINFDTSSLKKISEVLEEKAPNEVFTAIKNSFKAIGTSDLRKLRREQLKGGSGLNVRAKGLGKVFKSKVSGKSKDDLQLREYVGWQPAIIFETGGKVVPDKAKNMMILFNTVKDGAGKRILNRKQIRALITSGELKIIKTKSGVYVVAQSEGKTEFVGKLVKSITQKKRLSFFKNYIDNEPKHEQIYQKQLDLALERVANQINESK